MVRQYQFKQRVNVIINNNLVKGMVIDFNEKNGEYMVQTDDGMAFLYDEFHLRPIDDSEQ